MTTPTTTTTMTTQHDMPISSRTRSSSVSAGPSSTLTSTSTVAGARPPPRYSGLGLTPPPTLIHAPTPQAAPCSSLSPSVSVSSSGSSTPEVDLNTLRPPRYSSVFLKETVERTLRPRPRRVNPTRCHPDQTFDSIATASSHLGPVSTFLNHSTRAPQELVYGIGASGSSHQGMGVLRLFALAMTRVCMNPLMASSSSASASGSGSDKIPRFSEGERVNGVLELKFDHPQLVSSIQVLLRGRIAAGSYKEGSLTFLEQPIVSWTKSSGDPRSISPPPGVAELFQRKKFDGKLSGEYLWPFSFPFPEEVVLPHTNRAPQKIPQTFSDRKSNVVVQYELVVKISHGMLRSYTRLSVPVAYVPDVAPPPLTLLRQLAYSERCPVPGPDIDPEGWHSLHPITFQGKYPNKGSRTDVQCTLSISNPQTYTRGAIIPCHLTLTSQSHSALLNASDPEHISLRLIRRVRYYQDPNNSPGANSVIGGDPLKGATEETSVVGKAVWWTVPMGGGGGTMQDSSEPRDGRIELQGEVHLERELQSSCDFRLLSVSYAVELYPFDVPGARMSSRPLISHPVRIVTRHADGPIPVAVTQPPIKVGVRKATISASTSSSSDAHSSAPRTRQTRNYRPW